MKHRAPLRANLRAGCQRHSSRDGLGASECGPPPRLGSVLELPKKGCKVGELWWYARNQELKNSILGNSILGVSKNSGINWYNRYTCSPWVFPLKYDQCWDDHYDILWSSHQLRLSRPKDSSQNCARTPPAPCVAWAKTTAGWAVLATVIWE